MKGFRAFCVAAIVALAAGCSSSSVSGPAPLPSSSGKPPSNSIQHVVILLQENRSFNNLFMSFPGAETATQGNCIPYKPPYHKPICSDPSKPVQLSQITLETNRQPGGTDLQHDHAAFEQEYNGGKMDGFDTIGFGTSGELNPALFYPYAFVSRKEV